MYDHGAFHLIQFYFILFYFVLSCLVLSCLVLFRFDIISMFFFPLSLLYKEEEIFFFLF